jgi:dihydroorotate dehydrogenase (fumarate)
MVKVLLAGADVAMMTSALLRNGPDHLRPREVGLCDWADRHGFETLDQLRDRLSQRSVPGPAAFEPANQIKTLASHPVASPAEGPASRVPDGP